jgi:photosystem II stability/assembly factor-like uncharacterized protein
MHRLSIITLAFVPFVLLLAASPLAAAWHFLPAGAPSFTFVSDSSAQRMLMHSYNTGLWLTTNGGESWGQINDRLASAVNVGDIAGLIPADPRGDSIFIPFFESNATMFTADGCLTWQPSPFLLEKLQVSRAYRDTWFTLCPLCSPVRINRSHDRGLTWPDTIDINVEGRGYFRNSYLYQSPFRDSTVFAVLMGQGGTVDLGGGVYRSDDLGSTWTWVLHYYRESANVQIAALSNDSILVTTLDWSSGSRTVSLLSSDGGTTWDTLTPWSEFGIINTVIEDRFHRGHLLMATDYPLRLLRSEDFGATWNPTGIGLPAGVDRAETFSQDYYSGMLTLQADGIYISRDFGEDWTAVPMPPIGLSGIPFSITPEAVFVSRSELQPPYERWRAITFPPSNADTSVTTSPVLYKHADTLAVLTRSVQQSLAAPQFDLYRMAYSRDNGATWSFGPSLNHALEPRSVKCAYGENSTRLGALMVRSGSNGADTLFLSDDLGANWRASYVSALWRIRDFVISGSDIYLSEAEDTIRHSTDGGFTWHTHGRHFADKLIPVGSQLLVGIVTQLYRWQDSTWAYIGECPGFEVAVVNPLHPLLVTSSHDTLYVSADTGLNWQARYFDLPTPQRTPGLNNLAYDPYRQRLWANTAAGSVYLELSELSAGDGPVHFHPVDYSVLSVYPNPFNSEARITYDLESRGRVQLDLYNLEGRLVRTLTDEIQVIGRHELHFSGAGLSSGIYFARLTTPIRTRTQKIVLLK